jgi:hypothetical protein
MKTAAPAAVFFFPERPMKNLQEATERICDLKGSLVALDALVTALLDQMPDESRADLLRAFSVSSEVARTVLLHASVSDVTISAFERDVSRMSAFIGPVAPDAAPHAAG